MPIHFDRSRMERVLSDHLRWWNGELDRPLVKIELLNAHSVERRASAPLLSQKNCADFSLSPEQIIDAFDEELSTKEYMGDAFPIVDFISFGPGVLAAFCGAKLDNSSGAVWFFPPEEKEIGDIHVRYDPHGIWAERLKSIYRAGIEKWNGSVVMGMTDLGGVMDVAATFCGSEKLLMDLYDEPGEVKRLEREIRAAWFDAYNDLSSVLSRQSVNTNWSGLLSDVPSYIIQCDFCYMIGNPMFREFVLEGLREDAERLGRTIYHLDGVGQLNHLDDILGIEKLGAVQWVYGDGKPNSPHWLDVYRRITGAGKNIMISDGPTGFAETLSALHGSPYCPLTMPNGERAFAEKILKMR